MQMKQLQALVEGVYLDTDGMVHAQLGFGGRGGFVLVRPDLYVSYVGWLSAIDELLA